MKTRHKLTPNPRIGMYYAAGAACAVLGMVAYWPWAVLLLWPALSMGAVAGAYFWWGPRIYRKRGGRLPLTTWILLAPTLLGQHLSLLYYKRQCRRWDTAVPGILMGRQLTGEEAVEAVKEGVTAVLDLTCEFSEAKPFLGTSYRNIPVLDLTAPTLAQLKEAVAFMETEVPAGLVYVHCKIGYSRTAAVVGAYLLSARHCHTVADAVALMRAARPSLVIRPEALAAMATFREWDVARGNAESARISLE